MKKLSKVVLLFTIIFSVFSTECYALNTSYKNDKGLYSPEGEEILEYAKYYYDDYDSYDYVINEKDVFAFKYYRTKPLQSNETTYERRFSNAHYNGMLNDIYSNVFTDDKGSYSMWKVSDGKLATLTFKYYEDGTIEWIRSTSAFKDNVDNTIDFDKVEIALNSLGTYFGDENLTIKYIDGNPYQLKNIIYINYNNRDYFVPFVTAAYEPFSQYQTGKLYTWEEFKPWINAVEEKLINYNNMIEKQENKNDSDEGNAQSDKGDSNILIIALISASLIIVLAFVLFIIKKRKNRTK